MRHILLVGGLLSVGSVPGVPPASPLLRRALLLTLVAIHVMAVLAPADVLAPVDPWEIGRKIWEGAVPYRDFGFEYPPGAILAFLLPGAVPKDLATTVLALEAVAAEVAVVLLLRRFDGALWRWVPFSILLFPFLAGGFDALPMAAIAWSTALLAAGAGAGWWVAAAGAAVKLVPGGAWVWGRRGLWQAVAALVVIVPVLLAPGLLARHPDDAYIGYTLHRGVQVESVAASTTWLRASAQRPGVHLRVPVQGVRDRGSRKGRGRLGTRWAGGTRRRGLGRAAAPAPIPGSRRSRRSFSS